MTDLNSTKSLSQPSLLPYLQTGKSGIHICFAPREKNEMEKLDQNESIFFPFQTINRKDPFARILNALLESDAGSRIADLSIWLQRDDAHPEENKLPKATNTVIEDLWCQAYAQLSKNKHTNDCLIHLGEQLSDSGRLLPFQPLLVCQHRQLFFSPPCPLCGGLLDLCRDDQLLTKAGLKAYSQSLTRYLFCPTCYQLAGETDFYIRQNSGDNTNVKTAADLITSLHPLISAKRPSPEFPCRTCSKAPQCHANGGPVTRRLTPFAFYPFHMIAFMGKTRSENPLSVYAAARGSLSSPPPNRRINHDEGNQNIKEEKNQPVPPETTSNIRHRTVPDATPSPHPDKVVDDDSILVILDRIHHQWQKKASQESNKNGHSRSPVQPTQQTPSELKPKLPPKQHRDRSIPGKNKNQDLNETIIVQTGKNRERHRVPSAPPTIAATINDAKHLGEHRDNKDLPETIIVKAERKGQNAIWPQEPLHSQEPPQSKKPSQPLETYPSQSGIDPKTNIKDTGIRPQTTASDALPETIIVRPGEKVPPQPETSTKSSHDSSIWPQGTTEPSPDRPFTLGNTTHDNPIKGSHGSGWEDKQIKTFKIDTKKKHHLPDTKPSKSIRPNADKGDDQLEETVVVSPRSKKRGKR